MADENAPKQHEGNKTANHNKQEETKNEGVKVRLVAKFWQRAVPDTKPVQFQRINQGAEFYVTQAEFDSLNSFKTSLVKVDE